MKSYKLYMIITAITCIALQEISCASSNQEVEFEEYEESETSNESDLSFEKLDVSLQKPSISIEESNVLTEEPSISVKESNVPTKTEESLNCKEYTSKIWDEAFSNPMAIQLMNMMFDTIKVMGNDEVCSDTIRSFFNMIRAMSTDINAHYTLKMFSKMIATILKETNTDSEKFKETKEVVDRIANQPEISKLINNLITQTVSLLKNPTTRSRLITLLKAIRNLTKRPVTEKNVRKINELNVSTKEVKKGKNRVIFNK